jgi:hypothetical protein
MVKAKCPPHWWEIDALNIGRCKFCGREKQFTNRLKKFGRRYQVMGVENEAWK